MRRATINFRAWEIPGAAQPGRKPHTTIQIQAADPAGCDSTEAVWAARRHGAGVIARLALMADPYLRNERQHHTCSTRGPDQGNLADPHDPPRWVASCDVEMHESIHRPLVEPFLYLHVQREAVPAWRERLLAWVAMLDEHDRMPATLAGPESAEPAGGPEPIPATQPDAGVDTEPDAEALAEWEARP